MSQTNIISVGNINTEPGSGYVAVFVQSFVPPESTVSRVARDTDAPIVTHVAQAPRVYYLQVLVEPAAVDDMDDRRRAILREFDSTRGPLTVVIENAAGTARRRYMLFVVGRPSQVEGQLGDGFMAPVESYDQVFWTAVTPEEVTWQLDGSATQDITVPGDIDVYPTYTLTPNAAKAAPNWPYSYAVLVEWRSGYGGKHVVEVSGGLDTATLLANGKVTDGSNIAVFMNGTLRRHWYQESGPNAFGTAATQIWIEMEPRPVIHPRLAKATPASATTWSVENDTGMPATGTIKVDDEIVSYNSRGPGVLYGVTRARYGTTAAEHAALAPVTVYAGVGMIFYGPHLTVPDSLKSTEYRNARRPVMIAPGSSNAMWRYEQFAAEGAPGRWWYYSHLNSLGFSRESDPSGAHETTWQFPWTAMGLLAGWTSISSFTLRLAVAIKQTVTHGRLVAQLSPASSPSSPVLTAFTESGNASAQVLWFGSFPRDSNQEFATTSADIRPYDLDEEPLPGYNRLQWQVSGASYLQVDIQQLDIVFDETATPVVTRRPEQTDYDLDLAITNLTTGESIAVVFPNMAPGESLVIDSQTQTVTYTLDGSSQYPLVQRNAPRPKFLRLVPGVNQLSFVEEGMGEIEVAVSYAPGWYT